VLEHVDGRPACERCLLADTFFTRLRGLLGRPVEWVLKDDQSKPDLARTLYEQLVTADKVDCASLDTPDFPVHALMGDFVDGGGRILACGTCLQHRGREGSELCPVSTMKDLYGLVRDADKVLSF